MTIGFLSKFRTWKEQLSGADRHAIWRSVATLFRYDAVWRTYNKARGISHETKDPSTGLAGSIIEVLDEGFFCLQIFGISKLVERNWAETGKQIYSLRRLFDEIKTSKDLFTRERYVTHDGISYEADINEDWRAEFNREYRHKKYDVISEISVENRSKNDKLSSAYLAKIEKEFSTFENLGTYRNKFLAHAADPVNRPEDILDEITLAYFDKCYKSIIKIGKMLELLLDDLLICGVPVLQYDVLENWDKPAVTSNDISKLRKYWDEHLKRIEIWNKTTALIKSDE